MRSVTSYAGTAIFALIASCNGPELGETAEFAVTTQQAVTLQGTLSFSLPLQVPVTEAALGASRAMLLKDRVKVIATDKVPYVASTGTSTTSVGADSQIRHLVSVGSLFLSERVKLDGNAVTAGTITTQNGVEIKGQRQEHATLTPKFEFSRSISFAGGANITREPNLGTVPLSPGNYGKVSARSGSGFSLSPGTYYFESLTFEPQATFKVLPSAEPVIVFVRTGFDFKGMFVNSGSASGVFIGVLGTGTTSLEAPLAATVAVPNGVLRLAPANKTFQGSFFGKDVQVEPDLIIKQVPFAHWGIIFQVKPIVECVTLFGPGRAVGVFGYENQANATVPIVKGSNNELIPAADVPLPESFLPGRQKGQVLAPFSGSSVVWKLAGSTAQADSSVRRCDLADLPTGAESKPLVESPTQPSAEARSHIIGDNFTHVRAENGTLSWGHSGILSARTGGTRQLLGVTGAPTGASPGQFKIRFTSITVPDGDVGSEQEPILQSASINGVDIPANTSGRATPIDLPDCEEDTTCAITDQFAADVLPTISPVTVHVVIKEDDDVDNNNDTELILDLSVDNITGLTTGTATSPDPSSVTTVNSGDTCALVAGWGLCWVIEPNGAPKVCGSFNANFYDAGYGEDTLSAKGMQNVPSSFARAHFELNNSSTGNTTTWDGFLDKDGCLPSSATPGASDWTIGADTQLTAKLEATTQFCYDPSGADCLAADGTEKGARFLVEDLAVTPFGVSTQCAMLTTDEGLAVEGCNVVHPSEGAFANWRNGLPPTQLTIRDPNPHTPSTRIAAAVSQTLNKEATSGGQLGIEAAMIRNKPSGKSIAFIANDSCSIATGGKVYDRGSCYNSMNGNLHIVPDMICDKPNFADCFLDLDAGTYTPCDPETDTTGTCLAGHSRSKFVMMHEFGHFIFSELAGGLNITYEFNGLPDLPGAPELCTCAHVTSSNKAHCMQSLEVPSGAQDEGFAHYYAGLVWNDQSQQDCSFAYYKEFKKPDGVVEPTPVRIDCASPTRWRNTRCVNSPATIEYALADMGTELDWLGFYWNVTTKTSEKVPITDLLSIYRVACGRLDRTCAGGKISWEATAVSSSLLLAAQAYLPQDKADYFVFTGDRYGVSRDSTPLTP
jgi:hypothetical protein